MSINGDNNADMAGNDSEKVVTMMDVLQEEQDFEDDANAVLGASDDKNCTYTKGYIKRQAIYACLTCCSEAKEDPTKRAGVCLACSLACHENHELVELYTKRNFRCDCGNPKFNSHPCQFTPDKDDLNIDNKYDQNFSGLYCNCHRPYPDPESTLDDEEMIQCVICEDWLHASHLDAVVPSNDLYSEMICKACMDNNDFLHDYTSLAVNVETGDIDVTTVNGTVDTDIKEVTTHDTDAAANNTDVTVEGNESFNDVTLNNGNAEPKMMVNSTEDSLDTTEKSASSMDVDEAQTENEPVPETIESKDKQYTDKPAQETECSEMAKDTLETEKTDLSQLDSDNAVSKDDTSTVNTSEDSKKPTEDIIENKTENTDSVKQEPPPDNETIDETPNANTETQEIKNTKEQQQKAEEETLDSSKTEDTTIDPTSSIETKDISENTEGDKDANIELTSSIESKNENILKNTEFDKDATIEPTSSIECKDEIFLENTEFDKDATIEPTSSIESKDENILENTEFDKDATIEPTSSIECKDENVLENTEFDKDATIEPTSSIESKDENVLENTEFGKDATIEPTSSIDSKDENISEYCDSDKPSVKEAATDVKASAAEITSDAVKPTSETADIEMNDATESERSDITSNNENCTNNDITETDKPTAEICASDSNLESSEPGKDVPVEPSLNSIEVSNETSITEEIKDKKRKLSTEELDDNLVKKPKINEETCTRPRGKRVHRGATFWPSHFRQKLCTCSACLTMYKDLSVLFLLDPEDTVIAYETLGKERVNGRATQYEKGLEALSSLDRIQQINALTEYNKMKDKLLDFLKSFKDRKEIVKEDDIKAFFAGMKPKREPDGVYFCR